MTEIIHLVKIYSTDIKNKILFSNPEILLTNILSELKNFFRLQGQDFLVKNNDNFVTYTIFHQINSK